jgi:CheY-like chemotaxis protein
MERPGRILIVDDNERWRTLLQEILEPGGFRVDTAGTVAEALRRMDESFYHLLVLDIRMEDDDATNVEGMDLLRSLETIGGADAVRVIMLSAYGSKEQMREAFRDRHVEDFLTKEDFDDIAFLAQVRDLFAGPMQINLSLAINWQGISGAAEMIQNTRYGAVRISRDSPPETVHAAAAELDDLLCRLFHRDESLLVQPLTAGRSDAGVLLAERFDAAGNAPPVVVKFSAAAEMRTEYRHFKQYIEGRIGGGRTTTVIGAPRYTPRLGGIVYSMLGAAGERFESFEDFYLRADVPQIQAVIQRLFFDTCRTWYNNPGVRRVHNLTEEYLGTLGYTAARLERALDERFKGVQGRQRLQFRALGDAPAFSNPLALLHRQPFLRSTFVCPTHGDLHAQNILVDSDLHAWLIDFLRTGPGHILRDVALLDTAVRIQLLPAEQATLEERWLLERTLWTTPRFSDLARLPDALPSDNPALQKAYTIARFLRAQIAQQIVLRSDDFSEYTIASFYYALNLIRFYSLPMVQREHALLAAGIMADQLGQ